MAPPSQLSIRDEGKFDIACKPLRPIELVLSRKFPRFSPAIRKRFFRDFSGSVRCCAALQTSFLLFRFGSPLIRVMKYLSVIAAAILALVLSLSSKRAAAQPVCSSPYIDNPQNRKLCATLANFFGLPNSLEAYSDEMRPNFGYGLPLSYKGRLPPSNFIENSPGTKRQDVDHVFLRFGRRR